MRLSDGLVIACQACVQIMHCLKVPNSFRLRPGSDLPQHSQSCQAFNCLEPMVYLRQA